MVTQHIRPSKDESFMEIAESVSLRSTCIRRRYGAVIVSKDGRIVSTGYNGAPRHRDNCSDLQSCLRDELNVKPGTHYELCRAVHAEANAIINGNPLDIIGGTLYLCGTDADTNAPTEHIKPCAMCERLILNAQIERVVMRDVNRKLIEVNPLDWEDDSTLLEEHRRNLRAYNAVDENGNIIDEEAAQKALAQTSAKRGGGCCCGSSKKAKAENTSCCSHQNNKSSCSCSK